MKTFISKFRLMFILIGMFLVTIMFGDMIPTTVKSFFYAVSLSIKNIIVFLLPVIVFIFLWSSLIALKNHAGRFIILLLSLVFTSNIIAINTGYIIGVNVIPWIEFDIPKVTEVLKLIPTWNMYLPQIITTKTAMIASIVLGLFFAFKSNQRVTRIAELLNKTVVYFLKRCFAPILPLFIFGFLLKLEHEKILSELMASYGTVFLLVVSVQLVYMIILYAIAANFKISKFWKYTKNILPASITAFSTASSAATMPITTMCTEKNLDDKMFARVIVPSTCNIHTLGSAICLTIIALATLKAFGMGLPDFRHFIEFAIYFALAKFAVAGVPGGVVVIAAPLLETYLGFTPEMIGLVTALYLLFDPFGTTINVSGNGAFAIIFSKIYRAEAVKKLFKYILAPHHMLKSKDKDKDKIE